MRLARIAHEGSVYLARLDDGGKAVPLVIEDPRPGRDALRDALYEGTDLAGEGCAAPIAFSADALLAPVRAPEKVIAIGLNYADHARESGIDPPKAPVAFVKTNNSLAGPGDAITYRRADSTQVDYEAELAVIIGRRARNVSVDDALDYVFGYTACNDVSARDAQFADGQWIRGKSFDTFCPLGPSIVTADEIADPQALSVTCRLDGRTMQDGTTGEMIFTVAEIISYLSNVMTLEPGDVIATGTPAGVGFAREPQVFLANGSIVEVEIEGIGVLSNPIVATE